ncbi:MAG: prepilin-type N-terminal cleavage/methylation domain-containing protein [Candidatus Brocadiia bacterium]
MTRNASGFTLIELSLVVALMAVTLVVIVSNMDSLIPATKINADARRVASFIETAFSQAVATGSPVLVVYDLDEQCYFLALPNNDTDEDPYKMNHTSPLYLPSGVKFVKIFLGDEPVRRGVVMVRVQPTGRLRAHSIFIEDDGDRKLTIEIGPLTGLASIYTGHIEPRSAEGAVASPTPQ